MTDDPSKRKQDGYTVSWQGYEIRYVVDELGKEFPRRARPDIEAAVSACKLSIQPSEGRPKLMACARRRLA